MKREDLNNILVPVLAVITAMMIGAILVVIAGANPVQVYMALLNGSVLRTTGIGQTIINTTPLILTGLSVAVAARAGLFNIGGAGQVTVGMLGCGVFAIGLASLPQPFHLGIELAAAIVAGAVWGAFAGFLKSARGAHEVITTIMLNYIAIRFGEYLLGQGGLLEQTNTQSKPFVASAGFPILWEPGFGIRVHFGIVLALGVAAAIWFLLARTSLGYRIRAVGLNPDAAEYGGISVTRTVVIAMGIAGALAGLGGAFWILGKPAPVVLSKADFGALQIGFTGIAVALLGRNTVPGVVVSAFLFGALDAGARTMQLEGGLEGDTATKLIIVIQGLIVFFVGIDAFFRKYVSKITESVIPDHPPDEPPAQSPPFTAPFSDPSTTAPDATVPPVAPGTEGATT